MGIHLPLLLIILTVAAAQPPLAAAQTTAAPPSEYPQSDANAVAGFIFVLLLPGFLIICVLVSCCCVCCCSNTTTRRTPRIRRYPSSTSASASIAGLPFRLPQRGLDLAAINSFPIFNYSDIKDLKIGKGGLSCAVCVSEFEDSDRLRLLPKCDHVFHVDCIDPWLSSHATCPICRAELVRVAESTRSMEEVVPNRDQIAIEVKPGERVRMFPRPHSTGHSLVGLGEDCERYTLRLPDEVRNRLDRGGTSDRWLCTTAQFSFRAGPLRTAKVGDVAGDCGTTVECPADKSKTMPSRPPV